MKGIEKLVFAASLFVVGQVAFAQDVKGAEAVLREVQKARETGATGSESQRLYQKALEDYRASYRTMNPEAAAQGWLNLADLVQKTFFTTLDWNGNYDSQRLQPLLEVLPQPESWPIITAGLRARASQSRTLVTVSMKLFGELLGGSTMTQWQTLGSLMSMKPKNEEPWSDPKRLYKELYLALAIQSHDSERIVKGALMSQSSDMMPVDDVGEGGAAHDTISLPDLVVLVGPKVAEKTILSMLAMKATIVVDSKTKTAELAQRLALKNISTLKLPQWQLVNSPQCTRLYEAMLKKFGKPNLTDRQRTYAMQGEYADPRVAALRYYVCGLILEGRIAEAAKAGRELKANAFSEYGQDEFSKNIDRYSQSPEIVKVFASELKTRPNSPFWDLLNAAAIRHGQKPVYLATIKSALAQPKISANDRSTLNSRLITAYLADGQVDKAVALMREQIKSVGKVYSNDASEAITSLATVGRLTGRKDLIEEAIKHSEQPMKERYGTNEGDDILLENGRDALLEQSLIRQLKSYLASQQIESSGASASVLSKLLQLYYRLGRAQDVMYLLDHAKDWGVKDAAQFDDSSGYYPGSLDDSTLYVVAWALAKTGHKAESLKALDKVLSTQGGYDPAYELLIELLGPDSIERLDRLFLTDQFEERPLIWKAVELKKLNRLEEAEAAVRKAISVDPTDGEEPAGRRIFAYAVLADIREARGDQKEAANLREVVKAVRLSEKGDELVEAGLLTQAAELYQQSLDHFKDAYCIQFRLAVQLLRQGKTKEAAEHYRRAYEVMPDQFGRMETECLNCEGVFEGEFVQDIANQVLTEMVKKSPKKPQVHYLIGFLRQSQGREAEALTSFKTAVKLDPDYLSAWLKMASLDKAVLSDKDSEEVALALLRLDPLQKHVRYGYYDGSLMPVAGSVEGLKNIWNAADQALKIRGEDSADPSIYPLQASTIALEAQATRQKDPLELGMRRFSRSETRSKLTPGMLVARNAVIAQLLQAMESLIQSQMK